MSQWLVHLDFGIRGRRTFFLFHLHGTTHAMDVTPFGAGIRFHVNAEAFKLASLVRPLSAFRSLDVKPVVEICVFGVAKEGYVLLTVSNARPVTAPLPRARRGRIAKRQGDGSTSARDGGSYASSGESDADLMEKISGDVSGSDSGGSVDTDIDSGVECGHVSAAPAPVDATVPIADSSSDVDVAVAPSIAGDDGDSDGPVEDGGGRRFRHAPGTWTTWESLWFYMTQTPGWLDLKIHLKGPLRNVSTGMGTEEMSKTMSPHLVGEQLDSPIRAKLLLRAWAVWRAKRHGWAAQRSCRMREVERQLEALERDISVVPGRLLGHAHADAQLKKWVPDLVERLLRAG